MGITHSTVVLTADDGTSEVGTDEWNAAHTITTDISPGSNDGASLGVEGTAWSDLFMADGGVVSFGASATCTIVGSAGTFVFNTAATERMRVDSAGGVTVGGAAQVSVTGSTSKVQTHNANGSYYDYSAICYGNSAGADAALALAKTRGASASTHTIVQSGDSVGEIDFLASDGSAFQYTAIIKSYVDGTPGAGDMPGSLVFYTCADGGTYLPERMRIDSSGYVTIGGGANITEPGQAGSHLQVIGTDNVDYCMSLHGYGATSGGPILYFSKTRDNTDPRANTILNVGDNVMTLRAFGADGTAYKHVGEIAITVDATATAGVSVPGRIAFATTPSGSASAVERMRIDSAGKVLIGTATSTVGALLTLASGTLTANAPALDISQTWNDGAVTFTGLNLAITSTAAGGSSKVFSFGVGSAAFVLYSSSNGGFSLDTTGTTVWTLAAGASWLAGIYGPGSGDGGIIAFSGKRFGWTGDNTASNVDVSLWRDAAATLAQRNSTTAQTFRVYNTYTDSSNYERAVIDWTTTSNTLTIGTEAAGTGAPRQVTFTAGNSTGFLFRFPGGTGCVLSYNNSGWIINANWTIGWGTDTTSLTPASTYDISLGRNAAGILEVNNGTLGTYRATKMSALYRTGIRTVTADFTHSANDSYIIVNKSSTASCTLMSATGNAGLELYIKTIAAQSVISGGTGPGVVPLAGGATASAIVAATAGKYAKLVSDGASWHIMEAN